MICLTRAYTPYYIIQQTVPTGISVEESILHFFILNRFVTDISHFTQTGRPTGIRDKWSIENILKRLFTKTQMSMESANYIERSRDVSRNERCGLKLCWQFSERGKIENENMISRN